MRDLIRRMEEATSGSTGDEALLKQVADVQDRVVKILDKAYKDIEKLWPSVDKAGKAILKSVEARTLSGSEVARLFKKYGIDASALDDQKPVGIYLPQIDKQTLDRIERISGVQLFPEPYTVKDGRWTLAEK